MSSVAVRRWRWATICAALVVLAIALCWIWLTTQGKERPLDYCIVHHPDYNIGLLGMEKLHPFDSCKYGRVFVALQKAGALKDEGRLLKPTEASREVLLKVHSPEYLESLRKSSLVARYVEVAPVALLPAGVVDHNLLRPMRLATGGTLLAAREALKRDLAINLGGGFHHASANQVGGFCVYADITLAIRMLQQEGLIQKAMIVDLDAHQGNGHEADFLNDDSVYIFDMYNGEIFPLAKEVKSAIDCDLALRMGTTGRDYLRLLKEKLPQALEEAKTDLLIYNAGTDVYENDPLGGLQLTQADIVQRDAFVLSMAMHYHVPVLMLLSGGYIKDSHKIISTSIINLLNITSNN